MIIQHGHKLTQAFCALASVTALALPSTARASNWCDGEAWYNSAFGSRHYETVNGQFVHANSILPIYREANPGAGVTCYQRGGYGSYSFGWYPNSNPDRRILSHELREQKSHSSYVGLGYEFARLRSGSITVAPGVFVGLFSGYPKLATPGLGGLTVIPALSFAVRGKDYGFEAKVISEWGAPKDERKAIVAMSWMRRF